MASQVVATGSGIVGFGGRTYRIDKGDSWWSHDPLVKANPQLFADRPIVHCSDGFDPHADERAVERATRAPGESRYVPRRGHR